MVNDGRNRRLIEKPRHDGVVAVELPQAPEAEEQVIGSLLLAPELIPEVAALVRPEDFFDEWHRATFGVLLSMHDEGVPVDVVSVKLTLSARRTFAKGMISAAVYLADAGRAVATASHAVYYAELVRTAAQKRRLYHIADNARAGALNGKGPGEIIDRLLEEVTSLCDDEASEAPTTELIMQHWGQSVLARERPKKILCGPPDSGLRSVAVGPELVTVFAAPSSVGKSALVHQLVFDALLQPEQSKLRALICSVEMTPKQIFNRQLARFCGISHRHIRDRTYDEDATPRVRASIEVLYGLAGRLDFLTPPFTIEHVAQRAEAFGADIVVLDYVQRFRASGAEDVRLQVNAVMDQAKRLAGQGRAMIVVSAVNRGEFTLDTASLACLRESSELEYAADAAYLLIPHDANDRGRERTVTLRCAKNRDGETGERVLTFRAPLLQFAAQPEFAPNVELAEFGSCGDTRPWMH